MSVGQESVLWQNGLLDSDAVWGGDCGGSRDGYIRWGGDRLRGRGSFGGEFGASHCNQPGLCCVIVRERLALCELLWGGLGFFFNRMIFTKVGAVEDRHDGMRCRWLFAVPSGAPHNFTASVAGATSARLRWDPPVRRHRNGQIVLYELLYHDRRSPADDWAANTTDTETIVDGLQPSTDYVFHVRAYTSQGAGPWSSQLPFRTTNLLRESTRPVVIVVHRVNYAVFKNEMKVK